MTQHYSDLGDTENPAGDGPVSWRRMAKDGPSSRRKRVALSLSGGGMTGAFYEIGCLAALDDFLGFDFSSTGFHIYMGVSAGASVAALLAKGIPARKVYWGLLHGSELEFKRGDFYVANRWAILKSVLGCIGSIPGFFIKSVRTNQRPSPFE